MSDDKQKVFIDLCDVSTMDPVQVVDGLALILMGLIQEDKGTLRAEIASKLISAPFFMDYWRGRVLFLAKQREEAGASAAEIHMCELRPQLGIMVCALEVTQGGEKHIEMYRLMVRSTETASVLGWREITQDHDMGPDRVLN